MIYHLLRRRHEWRRRVSQDAAHAALYEWLRAQTRAQRYVYTWRGHGDRNALRKQLADMYVARRLHDHRDESDVLSACCALRLLRRA